jgi:hypothetical protein
MSVKYNVIVLTEEMVINRAHTVFNVHVGFEKQKLLHHFRVASVNSQVKRSVTILYTADIHDIVCIQINYCTDDKTDHLHT